MLSCVNVMNYKFKDEMMGKVKQIYVQHHLALLL